MKNIIKQIIKFCAVILIAAAVQTNLFAQSWDFPGLSAEAKRQKEGGNYVPAFAEYKAYLAKNPRDYKTRLYVAREYNFWYQTLDKERKAEKLASAEMEIIYLQNTGKSNAETEERIKNLKSTAADLRQKIKPTTKEQLDAFKSSVEHLTFIIGDTQSDPFDIGYRAEALVLRSEILSSRQFFILAVPDLDAAFGLKGKIWGFPEDNIDYAAATVYDSFCRAEGKKCDEAEKYLEKYPYEYGGSVKGRKGKHREAIAFFTDLIKIWHSYKKENIYSSLFRAANYYAVGDVEKAIDDLKIVIADSRKRYYSLAAFELGNIYLEKENLTEAQKYFRLAEAEGDFSDKTLLKKKIEEAELPNNEQKKVVYSEIVKTLKEIDADSDILSKQIRGNTDKSRSIELTNRLIKKHEAAIAQIRRFRSSGITFVQDDLDFLRNMEERHQKSIEKLNETLKGLTGWVMDLSRAGNKNILR